MCCEILNLKCLAFSLVGKASNANLDFALCFSSFDSLVLSFSGLVGET